MSKIKRISKTEALDKELNKKNQITYLESPKDIAIIEKMNKEMDIVRREFKVKEAKSKVAASRLILTC